jgi:hypothetical protein
MAEQVDPSTMGGAASDSGTSLSAATAQHETAGHGGSTRHGDVEQRSPASLGPFPSYHGRRVSWIAIGIVVAGFLCGGLALIFGSHGPTWFVFWIGVALAAVGILAMIATNTFNDWY